MFGMNLAVYILTGLIVFLSTILVIKSVRRRRNITENIWEVANTETRQRVGQMQTVQPHAPPPPHVFRQY